MDINKLYIYGCSFSHDYWISKDNVYPHMLAKRLKKDYISRAEPASCHDEIFHKFTKDLNKFTKGDFIVYQFTSENREGYMINNDSLYLSSAALRRNLKEYAYILDTFGKGRTEYKVSDSQLITLLDYIDVWTPHSKYYKYNRVFNMLEFLKNSIGINYVMIFLDNGFQKYVTKNYIKFPIESDTDNLSICDWVVENKWTLGDSRPEEVPYDSHPDELGHMGIYNKILSYIQNDECK
jgi:hypothetical protein